MQICTNSLGVINVPARLVPCSFSKRDRLTISITILAKFEEVSDQFIVKHVTEDETWFQYCEPENIQ